MERGEVREEVLQGRLLNIGLGTPLKIQIGGGEGMKLTGTLIGMVPEDYLMIRIPVIAGVLDKLREESQVTLRYVYCGGVYGFNAAVLHWIHKPQLILFLSYPRIVEVLNLRKDKRLDSLLPVAAEIKGNEFWGVILDLSVGGCRLIIESQGGELPSVQLGDDIVLLFQLAGIVEHQVVSGKAKNIHQDAKHIEIGLEFDESNSAVKRNIGTYIASISRQG